jgi:hypothetical protein
LYLVGFFFTIDIIQHNITAQYTEPGPATPLTLPQR